MIDCHWLMCDRRTLKTIPETCSCCDTTKTFIPPSSNLTWRTCLITWVTIHRFLWICIYDSETYRSSNWFSCPFQSRWRWKVSSILWNNGGRRRIKQAAWCWAALKWEYRSFMYLNGVLTQVISTYSYNNGTLVNSFGLNCAIFVFSVYKNCTINI